MLQADFQALDVQGYCDAAHLRYAKAARAGRTGWRRANGRHDPHALEVESELPAAVSPDFMDAAIRFGPSAAEPWRQRMQRIREMWFSALPQRRRIPGPPMSCCLTRTSTHGFCMRLQAPAWLPPRLHHPKGRTLRHPGPCGHWHTPALTSIPFRRRWLRTPRLPVTIAQRRPRRVL